MVEPAIRTEHLSRDFGPLRAVDGLTLEVSAGTVFGFLGPNGSGKTTTIRLLLGLLEPSGGSARVLGYDARRDAARIRERTGALLEHAGLYERLSAEANLEYYARIWRLGRAERLERIRGLLQHFGLWERRSERAGAWSRGMKQKLAIARALLHRPELVFLDEPTAGLDPVAAVALRADIASLAEREGVTVFVTTHNLAEAEKLCGRVGVIRAGRLLAVATPAELRRRAGAPRLEIHGANLSAELARRLAELPEVAAARLENGGLAVELRGEASAARLVRLIVEAGGEIEEVRRAGGSFEDAFLGLLEEPS